MACGLTRLVQGGVDQADVCKRLGSVAQVHTSRGVEFFGEQAQVPGVLAQSLEDVAGLGGASCQCERGDEPEAAEGESAFPAGKAVAVGGRVPPQ